MDRTVLVAGETLVDFLPGSETPLAATEEFARRPGGAPANVAVRLAQIGRPPWFWTRVGRDPFGDFLAETLADRGVPDRFVERDPSAKTSLAFVSGDPDSGPRFTFYRDGTADTRLEPGRVPDAVLDAGEWVVVGSVALASSPSREATRELVERASDRDCAVVFDLNARPELWADDADYRAELDRVLPMVDVVKASPEDLEPAGVTGDPTDLETVAPQLHERGPHTVFLTLGGEGAAAASTADAPWGAAAVTHEGFTVDAVDTTGAGDAFTAGVVDALAGGERDPVAVLRRGNAVAAASTTRYGGMSDLPDPDSAV
ncbi:MAG: carbohydrate kinase [Halosimplex sp.]